MKKKFIIPILAFLMTLSAWSQKPSNERIRAMKVAHITDKLDLTPAEAQQFWPIYNAFDDKASNIRQDLREIRQTIRRSGGTLPDTKAKNLLNRLMAVENESHLAKITLVNDLKEVLSAEKIIRLKAAEDEFNKILLKRLKELRDRRQNRKN